MDEIYYIELEKQLAELKREQLLTKDMIYQLNETILKHLGLKNG